MANGTGWQEAYLNEAGKTENGSQEKEERFFDTLTEDIKKIVRHFAADNGRPMRGNHAKMLAGITRAEFRVVANLPADLSAGFLIPGKVYHNTLVRFSNASSQVEPDDSAPDLRGVAIRVRTEQGDHDFLMTNAEQHHARDAREAMVAIMAARVKASIEAVMPGQTFLEKAGRLGAGVYLLLHLGPATTKRMAASLSAQMGAVRSLAVETYWSRAPIAIGNVTDPEQSVAVKYKLEPVLDSAQPAGTAPDLGQELEGRLNQGEVRFQFKVQRYLDPDPTPIEDATVIWPSDWETIAELVIPQGTQLDDTLDGLAFSPWNVDQTVFRPLGSMNRARKKVYVASAGVEGRPIQPAGEF
jgi:hypothetical protein